MTKDELREILQRETMSLADEFDSEDFDSAISDAEMETGWSLPQTTSFRILWLKKRSKRHLYSNYMEGELAGDFQYKQIHLEQPFEHFVKLIDRMDKEFEKAIEQNITEFANVDTFKLFGTKVDAGFSYEPETGRDLTFSSDNEVIITPGDSD